MINRDIETVYGIKEEECPNTVVEVGLFLAVLFKLACFVEQSAKLRIPAETQSGQVFRLRGKGIKALRAIQHGDLMCHVQVETPVKLTDRQKELLREFDAISQGAPAKHNPKAQSFMDKLKDFFGG